jgi:hypothetical protein
MAEITIQYENHSLIQTPNCWQVVVRDDSENSLIPTVHKVLSKGRRKNWEEKIGNEFRPRAQSPVFLVDHRESKNLDPTNLISLQELQ